LYIENTPEPARARLKKIRQTIRKLVPDAEELISYQMPAFKFHGPLVYYAAFPKHIGFYATPTGHEEFKKELSVYKQGKGSVQFPLDEPLPIELISKIVKFRAKENVAKEKKNMKN
jgi:uncharacterized protein YdhG (YjbR/CyaY superfamily)